VSDFPFFFVVNANSKYKTMTDIVAAARTKDGAVSYGSAGVGTGQHLSGELFSTAIKAKLLHVPFRGDSAALNGLLSGDIDFIIAPVPAIAGNLDGGTVRALGTSGAERWPAFPDVPTVAETVVPGFEFMAYVALATTKGVPASIIEKLNDATRKILAMPAIEKRLRDLGGTAKSSTSDEMKQKLASSISRFKAVIDEAGIPRQ
jgi:tripartite-type tricarboxylate transporter receptor subunit TctC